MDGFHIVDVATGEMLASMIFRLIKFIQPRQKSGKE
jgi:hypothetical protein